MKRFSSHRLNATQRIMSLWEEVHPYNAGHVVFLRGRADDAALERAINVACERSGVGKLVVDRIGSRYHYEPADAIPLRRIDCNNLPMKTLCKTVTEQINNPFPDQPCHPVRWYLLDDAVEDRHFVIAIYRHLAADSFSIRLLLRRVLNEYYGIQDASDDGPLQVCSPRYAGTDRRNLYGLRRLPCFLHALKSYGQLRHVHRLRESQDMGENAEVLIYDGESSFGENLQAACRDRGVKLTIFS